MRELVLMDWSGCRAICDFGFLLRAWFVKTKPEVYKFSRACERQVCWQRSLKPNPDCSEFDGLFEVRLMEKLQEVLLKTIHKRKW